MKHTRWGLLVLAFLCMLGVLAIVANQRLRFRALLKNRMKCADRSWAEVVQGMARLSARMPRTEVVKIVGAPDRVWGVGGEGAGVERMMYEQYGLRYARQAFEVTLQDGKVVSVVKWNYYVKGGELCADKEAVAP